MIKSFTISEKELEKRFKYTNKEIFKEIEALDKSVIMMGSHYANWEWITNIQSKTRLKCIAAYTRLTNPYYDKLVRKNRSRFGSEFVPTSRTIKKMIDNKNNGTLSLYGLLSDQSPHISKTHYWAPFLGRTSSHTYGRRNARKETRFLCGLFKYRQNQKKSLRNLF
jgi:KDO2-lipid IV(A) lauroyltransferase